MFLVQLTFCLTTHGVESRPYPTWNSLGTWTETLKVDNKLKPQILLIMFMLQWFIILYHIGSAKRWKKFVDAEIPEKEKFPGEWKNKTSLQKLCMMRALRPDRMTYAVL